MRTFVMIRSIAGTFPPSGVNLSRVAMKGCFTKPSLACHGARFVQLPVSSSIVLSYASKISQGSLRPPDSYSGRLQRVVQRGANVRLHTFAPEMASFDPMQIRPLRIARASGKSTFARNRYQPSVTSSSGCGS